MTCFFQSELFMGPGPRRPPLPGRSVLPQV